MHASEKIPDYNECTQGLRAEQLTKVFRHAIFHALHANAADYLAFFPAITLVNIDCIKRYFGSKHLAIVECD